MSCADADAPAIRSRKRKLADLREMGQDFVRPGNVRVSAVPWNLYKRVRYRAELEFAGMRTPMLAAVWINDWLVAPRPMPVFQMMEKRRRLHSFRLPELVWHAFDHEAERLGRDPEALLWDLLAEQAPMPGWRR